MSSLPSDEIHVRPATVHDAAELLQLWQELMELHVSLDPRFTLADRAHERFLGYLDLARSRDDYHVLVADHRDGPVGFVIACVLPNSPVYRARWIGYINDLCVTDAWRGRGVGRMLVEEAVAWLRHRGADSVEVYVAHSNPRAFQFWKRMGGREYLLRLTLASPQEAE